MLGWNTVAAYMWLLEDPSMSSWIHVEHGVTQLQLVCNMLSKLLHLWGHSWREVGSFIGCPAHLPARTRSQSQGYHGLVLVSSESF